MLAVAMSSQWTVAMQALEAPVIVLLLPMMDDSAPRRTRLTRQISLIQLHMQNVPAISPAKPLWSHSAIGEARLPSGWLPQRNKNITRKLSTRPQRKVTCLTSAIDFTFFKFHSLNHSL
jgi:hypothetical protein